MQSFSVDILHNIFILAAGWGWAARRDLIWGAGQRQHIQQDFFQRFVVRPELSREKKVFFGVQPDMWADTRAPPTHSRVGRVGLLELVKNKKEIDRVISFFFLNEYFVNIDSISMLLIHQVSVIPYNPLLHISLTKLVAD